LLLDHEFANGVGRDHVSKVAQFEMAPHSRFRSVPKYRAMPIERLPDACFPKTCPVNNAVLEFGIRSAIPRSYRPGKYHEAVARLNPGQMRPVKGADAISHWTPQFKAYPKELSGRASRDCKTFFDASWEASDVDPSHSPAA
jgi:hypothetical protein